MADIGIGSYMADYHMRHFHAAFDRLGRGTPPGDRIPSRPGAGKNTMYLRKTKERKRLSNLKREADEHPSVNTAKRYKLPEAAVDIISKAGVIHGQQSRAIQIGAELLWRSVEEYVPDADMSRILDSPLTGKTYKLPGRTIHLIEVLTREYGTRGKVLAAIAYIMSKPEPRKGLRPSPFSESNIF
jgi:hypothetical protein